MSQLETYRDGVLGIVFDTLDRVQHMIWKDQPDVIEQWYLKLDALIGRIEEMDPQLPIDAQPIAPPHRRRVRDVVDADHARAG